MSAERNLTISKKLMNKIKNGDIKDFMKDILKIGENIGIDGEVKGVRGPYILQGDEDNQLYIISYDKKSD